MPSPRSSGSRRDRLICTARGVHHFLNVAGVLRDKRAVQPQKTGYLPVLLDTAGIDRIVYGVDFPYPSLEAGLEHGNEIDCCGVLTDEQRKTIYLDNAKKLLRL